MNLRRFQRQRVSKLAHSNSVKIKSEEETFPCLSQAGESASSFLDPRAMSWAPLDDPQCTPWTSFVGSLVHPVGPLGHLGDPLGPPIVLEKPQVKTERSSCLGIWGAAPSIIHPAIWEGPNPW